MDRAHITGRELPGLPEATASYGPGRLIEVAGALNKARDDRPVLIVPGLVPGSVKEAPMSTPGLSADRYPEVAEYLELLAGCGYELPDIEKLAADACRPPAAWP